MNESLQESWTEYQARISTPGYQSPLVHPDDSPLTLQEHLQLILNDIDEASPHEPLGRLLVKALRALIDIAESLNAQPDYSDQCQRLIEVVTGIERNLVDIKNILEEPPEATTQGGRPPKPPHAGRGGTKSRRKASPSLERLRKSRKEGG